MVSGMRRAEDARVVRCGVEGRAGGRGWEKVETAAVAGRCGVASSSPRHGTLTAGWRSRGAAPRPPRLRGPQRLTTRH
jgi:hypothetical protein